jgi:hypothetical protein
MTVQTDLQDIHAKNNNKYPNEKAPEKGLFLWEEDGGENEVRGEERGEIFPEVVHSGSFYAFLYSLTNVYTKNDILTMYPTAIG